MKRFYILVLIMAAAAVSACQNKAAVEEPTQGSYVFTLKASAPDAETKTDYSSTGEFSWSEGDAISVLFHNGDKNKFFTLTTTGSGATADFSGTIDEGFIIGASDGTDTDKKIWALFPASDNHTYSVGSNPTFFIPSETDFTASGAHFSANLPLYAFSASDESVLSFAHLTGAFKFRITDIDDSVNKIKFVVQNQNTYALSGSWPLNSTPRIDYDWAEIGSENGRLTLIQSVSDNQVVFYVPCKSSSDNTFFPEISIINAETGNLIKTLKAKVAKKPGGLGTIQQIIISAPGTGIEWSYESIFNIDWDDVSVEGEGVTTTGYDGINTVKATADASYFYLLINVDSSKLSQGDAAGKEYANYLKLYLGNESSASTSWMWPTAPNTYSYDQGIGWLTKNGEPKFVSSGETILNSANAIEHNGNYYYEIKLNRKWVVTDSNQVSTTYDYLTNAKEVHIGVWILNYYYAWGGSQINYIYATSNGSMLVVTLPTYVEP